MRLDSVSHLLPGLLPASFRGIAFDVPDTSTEVGRRLAEHLFPGRDVAAYDDMGLQPDRITVEGVLVGDDYIAQARRLAAAFRRAGPGTLIHPWLGGMTALLEEPAEISFSSHELRVARFDAVFKRLPAGSPVAGVSTAATLIAAAIAFATIAGRLLRSPARVSTSRVRDQASVRTARLASAAWSSLAPSTTAASAARPEPETPAPVRLSGAGATALIAAMPTALPARPDAVADLVERFAAILVAAVPEISGASLVAPAAGAPTGTATLAAGDGVTAGLHVFKALSKELSDAPSPTDTVMIAAAAGVALAAACRILPAVAYPSRSAAQETREAVGGAVDAFVEAVETLSTSPYAGPASEARRAATALKAAAIADINEAIGRLPAVVVAITTRPTDAFLIAQHLYGDEPRLVEAGYLSILGRNRHRHPAEMPAGRVEALK